MNNHFNQMSTEIVTRVLQYASSPVVLRSFALTCKRFAKLARYNHSHWKKLALLYGYVRIDTRDQDFYLLFKNEYVNEMFWKVTINCELKSTEELEIMKTQYLQVQEDTSRSCGKMKPKINHLVDRKLESGRDRLSPTLNRVHYTIRKSKEMGTYNNDNDSNCNRNHNNLASLENIKNHPFYYKKLSVHSHANHQSYPSEPQSFASESEVSYKKRSWNDMTNAFSFIKKNSLSQINEIGDETTKNVPTSPVAKKCHIEGSPLYSSFLTSSSLSSSFSSIDERVKGDRTRNCYKMSEAAWGRVLEQSL